MLTLKDISFAYNQNVGLKQISFQINTGDFVAFMGPNGSGKSTLFKLLVGLLEPDSGTYLFDDQPVTTEANCQQKLHQRIGFVFQNSETMLFNDSVQAELAFGPTQQGLTPAQVQQRVADILQLLQIEALALRTPYQLSGGEQKLVALGSILTMNPEIIILDEPFNGLSMQYQQQLMSLLETLNGAGKTVLLSSHNYQQIAQLVQRVIVFDAKHELVMDTPASALTDTQKEVLTKL